jgi:hypothetical protein
MASVEPTKCGSRFGQTGEGKRRNGMDNGSPRMNMKALPKRSKSRLPCGAPRLYPDARSTEARQYKAKYKALEEAYGPFLTDAVRDQAGVTAKAWQQMLWTGHELIALQQKRQRGRGRRPNAQQVERKARRDGINAEAYKQHEQRLEEMCKRQQHVGDPLAALLNGER